MVDFARLAEAVGFVRRVKDLELNLTVLLAKHPESKANLEADQAYFTSPVEVCDGLVLRGVFVREDILRRMWDSFKEPFR